MFKSLRKSVKWHQKQILTSHGLWRHIPRLVSWLGPCEYSHTGMVMKKCQDWTPEILDLLHRYAESFMSSLSVGFGFPLLMSNFVFFCRLVQLVNYEFNSCSLNLYRTGHDSNAWHSDIHPALGSNPPIASVSLGDSFIYYVHYFLLGVEVNHVNLSQVWRKASTFTCASFYEGALRTFEMKRKGTNATNFIRFPLFPGSLLIMEGATQADWHHQVTPTSVATTPCHIIIFAS